MGTITELVKSVIIKQRLCGLPCSVHLELLGCFHHLSVQEVTGNNSFIICHRSVGQLGWVGWCCFPGVVWAHSPSGVRKRPPCKPGVLPSAMLLCCSGRGVPQVRRRSIWFHSGQGSRLHALCQRQLWVSLG
jgi:hypothetical protein